MNKSEFALFVGMTGLVAILLQDKVRHIQQNNSEIVRQVEDYLRYSRVAALLDGNNSAAVQTIEKAWSNDNYKCPDIVPKVTSSR